MIVRQYNNIGETCLNVKDRLKGHKNNIRI